MILYVCVGRTMGKQVPGLRDAHPCAKAAHALEEAGLGYEIKQVGGARGFPWTWLHRERDRAEVKRLSGQRGVPILVLDDDSVVTGSGEIVRWARAQPRGGSAAAAAAG